MAICYTLVQWSVFSKRCVFKEGFFLLIRAVNPFHSMGAQSNTTATEMFTVLLCCFSKESTGSSSVCSIL